MSRMCKISGAMLYPERHERYVPDMIKSVKTERIHVYNNVIYKKNKNSFITSNINFQ